MNPLQSDDEDRRGLGREPETFDPVGNGNLPPMPYRDMPEPLPLGRVLGPSVILAGLGVGSGEYIIWPFMTATVGTFFLWAAAAPTMLDPRQVADRFDEVRAALSRRSPAWAQELEPVAELVRKRREAIVESEKKAAQRNQASAEMAKADKTSPEFRSAAKS